MNCPKCGSRELARHEDGCHIISACGTEYTEDGTVIDQSKTCRKVEPVTSVCCNDLAEGRVCAECEFFTMVLEKGATAVECLCDNERAECTGPDSTCDEFSQA